MSDTPLDDPSRASELRELIRRKAALSRWYVDIYQAWAESLRAVPEGGGCFEIGSGAGFAHEHVPGLLRTDTLPYEGMDLRVDALQMPWPDAGVRALFLLNVFHHLPDVEKFLAEAQRVLKPGGMLRITDQHVGPISAPLLRWAHHEPFRPQASEWQSSVTGPLAGANGALAWIVFVRDRTTFEARFPKLELRSYRTFAPLQYWLAGGLRSWSLVPALLLPVLLPIDRLLLALSPRLGSFVHIEIIKKS